MNEKEMRARLAAIDERMPQCRSELLELADNDMDEDGAARFEELEAEYKALEEERGPLAERLARLDAIREVHNRAQVDGRGIERGAGPAFVPSERRDPYADLDQVRGGMVAAPDLRARAMTAIEDAPEFVTDDQREAATRLVSKQNDRHGRIARHMLLTGSDAYLRAFEKILGGMQPYQLDEDEVDALRVAESHRAAMAEGTNSTGGYLVPFHLDPTVILTNAGSTNPFRQISRRVAITTNVWHGVSSAGVTAEWVGEATEAADASPSFAQPSVTVRRADAYLQASFEVTQDTGVAADVAMLLADARDNLEAAAFAVGTGSSNQPKGIVTAVAAVSGSVVTDTHASTAQFLVDDVYNVRAALPARHRPNASWVANDAIQLKIRQFASGTGPQHAFWADLGMDTPPQLLGKPIYESSAMDSTIADGKNILLVGDFSRFLIVDRIGMTVQYDPLVRKTTNGRPSGEVGWYATWRVGSDCLDPNAFRLLQIVVSS
jgi:HK97 family phage major capsid protein